MKGGMETGDPRLYKIYASFDSTFSIRRTPVSLLRGRRTVRGGRLRPAEKNPARRELGGGEYISRK